MKFAGIVSVLLSFLAAALSVPGAAQAGADPVLRIEAGMHIAPITALATDAANSFIATGSEDKTVRLWSLPDGRPGPVLRIPIGAGSVGKVYAVAVSPNGALVAVGGWTTSDVQEQIYLLDTRSGAILRRLTGLADVAASLAFSPDGQFLAAGLAGHSGIVVYDTTRDWARVAADTEYGGVVRSLAFDRTGRLATACSDGTVRLYAPGQFDHPRATRRLDGRASQLAFSPDGSQIAVAFADQAKVQVLTAPTLAPLFAPDMSGLEGQRGGFDAVAWSADGRVLLAGGSLRDGNGIVLRRWPQRGRGAALDVSAANDSIRQLLALRDGSVLFATSNPTFGTLSPTGAVRVLQSAGRLDFRAREGATLTSDAHGATIDAGVVFPVHRLAVSLRDRAVDLQDAGSTAPPPEVAVPDLSITNWRDDRAPALNGVPLPLEKSETARALAVQPDGRAFVLGTSWRLLRFDASGQKLWSKATEGAVWNTTISADGRVVVAAQGDGTIRWRRVSDGAELLALFVTPDTRRWVAWTPGGYYDASPGGESLIGWQIDQGPDTAPAFHPAWQFRDRFYRPDVVGRILDTLDETLALGAPQELGASKSAEPVQQAPVIQTIAASVPPTLTILDAPDPADAKAPKIVIGYQLTPPPGPDEPVAFQATIDGRTVTPVADPPKAGGIGMVSLVIPDMFPDKTLDVTLSAKDSHGASAPVTVPVKWHGSASQDLIPVLYVLAVGVTTYQDNTLLHDLRFPGHDAQAFADAMMAQKGKLYADVQTQVLIDQKATLANIQKEFRDLHKQMHAQDRAVIFLSGHGTQTEQDWAFEPYDADPTNEDSQLSGEYLNDRISALPGIKVLFLDSCFSGAALTDHGLGAYRSPYDQTRLINRLITAPTGVVVFSSSTGDQRSWEDPNSQHGFYTEALLEALTGHAAFGHEVGMYDLEGYLDRELRERTRRKQIPTMTASTGMPSIILAVPP